MPDFITSGQDDGLSRCLISASWPADTHSSKTGLLFLLEYILFLKAPFPLLSWWPNTMESFMLGMSLLWVILQNSQRSTFVIMCSGPKQKWGLIYKCLTRFLGKKRCLRKWIEVCWLGRIPGMAKWPSMGHQNSINRIENIHFPWQMGLHAWELPDNP